MRTMMTVVLGMMVTMPAWGCAMEMEDGQTLADAFDSIDEAELHGIDGELPFHAEVIAEVLEATEGIEDLAEWLDAGAVDTGLVDTGAWEAELGTVGEVLDEGVDPEVDLDTGLQVEAADDVVVVEPMEGQGARSAEPVAWISSPDLEVLVAAEADGREYTPAEWRRVLRAQEKARKVALRAARRR